MAASVWSSSPQPPVLLLCCGFWKPCVVICNATTSSAASRSATTLRTTGPSQVKAPQSEKDEERGEAPSANRGIWWQHHSDRCSATRLNTTKIFSENPCVLFYKSNLSSVMNCIGLSYPKYLHIKYKSYVSHFWAPVKEEALDAPSLARGSKRSLSGVSPPYAAPLSPKHLRTEAHPSEGRAHFDLSEKRLQGLLT